MNTQAVIYEQPLSERFRHFLQLEHHFQIIEKTLTHGTLEMDTLRDLTLMRSLIAILEILERKNVREIIQYEIKLKKKHLNTLLNHPDVNSSYLENTLSTLESFLKHMQTQSGKIPKHLKQNSLLNSIRHKMPITGTACQLELPRFHHWLHLDAIEKEIILKKWLATLKPFDDAIRYLISLTRNSASFESDQANTGFFQKSLKLIMCQLVRIQLDKNLNTYPEISASKHRLNIRFFELSEFGHPKQTQENVCFKVSYCCI